MGTWRGMGYAMEANEARGEEREEMGRYDLRHKSGRGDGCVLKGTL